ncbi:MAG: ATP-binding cassette domain-containing protein [Marinilabiliales bacterium]|nr:ATP-binding cassette domain-containing protein [Marinilabiliales bacterium]
MTGFKRAAREMNITDLLLRKPDNLSGGEKQRVALARTLVTEPKILLLDEPMASVDASLKDDIRRMLRRLNRSGQTIIHVTHDFGEAISLASRVGVMHNGRIIQDGNTAGGVQPPRQQVRGTLCRYKELLQGHFHYIVQQLLGHNGENGPDSGCRRVIIPHRTADHRQQRGAPVETGCCREYRSTTSTASLMMLCPHPPGTRSRSTPGISSMLI